jgi:hypothetical protein
VTLFKAPALAIALLGALALSACGPAAGTQAPQTGAPAAATTLPSAATSTSGAGGGGDSCGAAGAAAVRTQLASRTDIASITIDGGCHDVTISTSLADSDATTGLAICDSAAEVAYKAGDLSSITVLAASSKELSIGIKGQPCIGEP